MGNILLLSLYALATVVIVGIPLAISYFGYRWLKKTKLSGYAYILPTITISLLIVSIYGALHPTDNDDDCREYFETFSSMRFPSSGTIVEHHEFIAYPRSDNRLTPAVVIQVDEEDFEKFNYAFFTSANFQDETVSMKAVSTSDNSRIPHDIAVDEILSAYVSKKDSSFQVAFLKDKRRIVFTYFR